MHFHYNRAAATLQQLRLPPEAEEQGQEAQE